MLKGYIQSLIVMVLFASPVFAQEIVPFKEPVSITQDSISHFWETNKKGSVTSVGVFIDGGSLTKKCNGSKIYTSVNKTAVFSTFLKSRKTEFNFLFQDYGKLGKENLLLDSVCGTKNITKPDYSASNSWMVYKFNKSKECFEESHGISNDIVADQDIFVMVYMFMSYDMANKTTITGRDLPYSMCK